MDFGDDIIGALENWGEKALVPVVTILRHHARASANNREEFKKNDINLTQAHAAASSALMNLASRSAGKNIGEVAEARGRQLDLIAHFIQGIDLCEVSTVQGLYVQAASLLRQEHELISAAQEAGAGLRKDGRTPHATFGILKNMGRVYGELSGAAHVSQASLLRGVIAEERSEMKGPSIFPLYHRELARNLYALHVSYIVFMAWVAGDVNEALGLGGLSDDEMKLLSSSLGVLADEGLITVQEVAVDVPIAN